MTLTDAESWLVSGVDDIDSPPRLLHGFAKRLCDAGLDLVRLNVQVRPLSPQVGAILYVWRPAERASELSTKAKILAHGSHEIESAVVQETSLARGAFQSEPFKESPFFRVIDGGEPVVRCHIPPAPGEHAYPILADFAAQGATDYVAFAVRFHGSLPSGVSFATRRPGGFTDEHIEGLRHALPALRLAMSPLVAMYTTRVLLGAYLGPKTGERVLAGQVARGDVEEIQAAIWFSDLRGFTPISSSVDSRTLIAWLNEYFEAIGRAITQHEGEILKFIGDAVLAVWPVRADRDLGATARAALAAARAANEALDRLNETRTAREDPPMQHGIGLHVGPAQYGNIGAEGRLDFTVIGPAVNTASRLEGTCGKLGRRVIASADLAAAAGSGAELVDLGQVELKGIPGTTPVFGVEGA